METTIPLPDILIFFPPLDRMFSRCTLDLEAMDNWQKFLDVSLFPRFSTPNEIVDAVPAGFFSFSSEIYSRDSSIMSITRDRLHGTDVTKVVITSPATPHLPPIITIGYGVKDGNGGRVVMLLIQLTTK